MVDRALSRVRDMKQSIDQIRSLLVGKSLEDVASQPITRAAFERFLEILSEASRHVPESWRARWGEEIAWQSVAALGNRIRHEYRLIDIELLWSIYKDDLDPLERAVDAMLKAHAPDGDGT